ncbi:MAG: ABC transporter ATP-binding protein [Methanotrichaceae archaeon]
MLRIRGLKVSFGDKEILRGLDLDLEQGSAISIVGESGAGKTTLGLAIMGLVDGNSSGEIIFNGKDLLKITDDEFKHLRGNKIGMVFQNVEDALDPVYKVEDQIAEAILNHHKLNKKAAKSTVQKLLQSVRLSEEKGRSYPHQLSGGERQRALIAIALANDPDILILDEPTASLDALTKAEILKLFRSAVFGRISLVITHDLSLAADLTERMAVLYAGRIVEMGRTSEVMRTPRHPYTRGLIRSYPRMTATKDLQGIPGRMVHSLSGCPFHERCTQRVEVCLNETPPLKEIRGRLIACHRSGIVPLLEVKGLQKCFDSHQVLSDIDLTLYEGETLALVGESGSGKTTLARIIMGLYEPDSGDLFLEGKRVERRSADFYSRVQMIFQNPRESVSHRMNVLRAVREPLDILKWRREEDRLLKVREVLNHAELPSDDDFLAMYPHQLSGGEVQRVAIARALVLGPKLLIADEPTSSLDPSVQAKILKLLMNLQEEMGLAILFVTHDIALARKVSDRMAVLHRGRIVEAGDASEILTAPSHPYTEKLVRCAGGVCLKQQLSEPDAKFDGRPMGKIMRSIPS